MVRLLAAAAVMTMAGLVLLAPRAAHAQADGAEPAMSPTEQRLLRELEAMRQRIGELETEVKTLKAQQAAPVAAGTATGTAAGAAAGGATASPSEAAPSAAEHAAWQGPQADAEAKPVTAGYDGAFFIQSPDGAFRLNLSAYTQARWTANWRNSDEDADGDGFTQAASMNRTRLFLYGNYTDRFDYHIRTNIDDTGELDLISAYLTWHVDDQWSVRAGEQFMALSREDWMYGRDVLGPEFSPNDFTFAIGSSIGLQAHYAAEQYRAWFGISNGSGGGSTNFGEDESFSNVAITGRFEYLLGTENWGVFDDLVGRRGRDQGILLGIAGLAERAQDNDGDPTAPDATAQIVGDISFSGDGYQVLVGGTWRRIDPQQAGAFNNYGLLVQGGYFFTDEVQLYGRYDLIHPGDQPGDLDPFNAVAVGVNIFPFETTNIWKFSVEMGYLFEALDDTIVAPSRSLGWLSSDEPGQISLRAQAQFGF